ncbi:polysaccharide biosynthesis protein [Spirosoma harenae]
MKKFAFLVHVRSSYRTDLAAVAKPFGWLPESFYQYAFRNRPFPPFVWSNITLTPNATEPQGHVIMLPYSGQQLLQQQKAMMPRIEQGLQLAASLGAEIVGLGALTSPVTMGGKLLTQNPHAAITNGNAFTAVITYQKIAQLIQECPKRYPVVALVGATGSVGSLVSQLLALHQPNADYVLIARNERKLRGLATSMVSLNDDVLPEIALGMDRVKQADIVVMLTSSADALLHADHLKPGAVVLDDTVPRNTHPDLLQQRPDVTILDGGLVAMPHLRLSRPIGVPDQTSYACLAETMLLAMAGHDGHFSIGNPTLEQAEYIRGLARRFAHLGFCPAPDYSFGQPVNPQPAPTYQPSSFTTLPSFEPALS